MRSDNLSGIDLSGADLAAADLVESNLTGVNLTNADLDGAIMPSTGANGAIWSNTTCPDGTNSSTNGTSPQSCVGHGV